MYDLIVLGAGPGGYEAAAHAGALGKKTAIIEKQWLGGTCLNAGCIPAKSLLYTAKILRECRDAERFGIRIGAGGETIDYARIQQRKQETVAFLVKGVQNKLKSSKVEIIEGVGKIAAAGRVEVGSQILETKNILIATGSRAAVPPVTGIDLPHVLDAAGLMILQEPPAKLAVIGAGVIGLEMASFFAALGTQVSVVELLPWIASLAERDLTARLQTALEQQGITFYLSCKVDRIEKTTLFFKDADGNSRQIACDTVLNATGRKPNTDGIGLEAAGIDFEKQGIATDVRGRTNIPGIWACGDVTGRCLLAHAAAREGIVAVNNMFGKSDLMRYNAIPSVIYTQPELASVGMTEQQLQDAQIDYKKKILPLTVSGRYVAEGGKGQGYVKVLAGSVYHELLGVHILGGPAGEMIYGAAAMLEAEMTAADVCEIVFPHPTVSEVLKEAIIQIQQEDQ